MSQLWHEFGVTLERDRATTAWGIRLAGGSDLNSPLIIVKVNIYHNGKIACRQKDRTTSCKIYKRSVYLVFFFFFDWIKINLTQFMRYTHICNDHRRLNTFI